MGRRSGQSYSQDLRHRALGAADGGAAVRQAARFGVSIAYVYKALTRRRLTGSCGINPDRGHHSRELSLDQERALGALRHREHRSVLDIHAILRGRGVPIAGRSVTNLLDRYGEVMAARLGDPARLRQQLSG